MNRGNRDGRGPEQQRPTEEIASRRSAVKVKTKLDAVKRGQSSTQEKVKRRSENAEGRGGSEKLGKTLSEKYVRDRSLAGRSRLVKESDSKSLRCD